MALVDDCLGDMSDVESSENNKTRLNEPDDDFLENLPDAETDSKGEIKVQNNKPNDPNLEPNNKSKNEKEDTEEEEEESKDEDSKDEDSKNKDNENEKNENEDNKNKEEGDNKEEKNNENDNKDKDKNENKDNVEDEYMANFDNDDMGFNFII